MEPEAIRALFLAELEDLTASLSQGLLALEAHDDVPATLVDDLFRAAHSLKGAANVTGARAVGDVAHGMESVLSAVRARTLVPDDVLVTALFGAVDWLSDAAQRLASGEEPDSREARSVRTALTALAAGDDAEQIPPPARTASPAAAPSPGRAGDRDRDVVRVPATKLDALLRQASEVTVARQRVEALENDVIQAARSLEEHDRQWRRLRTVLEDEAGSIHPEGAAALDRADATWRSVVSVMAPLPGRAAEAERDLRLSAEPLADQVLDLRTMPFGQLCEGLERVARDAAHASGDKSVALQVEGAAVELDRPVAFALRDPLIHLVHNAVDHGIEPTPERRAAGKPDTGKITVGAELRGDRVEIFVRDDGGGLRGEAIRAAADRVGLGTLEHADDLVAAIFAPGVSTAPAVTRTSGRGVGLDAVRARVEAAAGTVDLVSTEGAGTVVTLLAPITLSVLHTLTVVAGDDVVMVCSTGVARVLHVDVEQIRSVASRPMMLVDGEHVPLFDLAGVLGWPAADQPESGLMPTLLVAMPSGSKVGLTVSALLAEGYVTVRPLNERVGDPPGVLGVTLLPEGGMAVILSASVCARLAVEESAAATLRPHFEAVEADQTVRILLAEDTMTTRVLEQGILEAAGYEVVVAVDGADAWQRLQEGGVSLVVSDVQMPNMDGLQLCAAIRASKRFAEIPVVLVTSLADDGDRRRGMEVGATAYLVKSGFQQGELLETIARLVG